MSRDYTLDDFSRELESFRRQGIKDLFGSMPGMRQGVAVEDNPEVALERILGMIKVMTDKERRQPEFIDAASRLRIAAASGTQPSEVEQFLTQFEQLRRIMRTMQNSGEG